MGKPLMLQEADDRRIEMLKKRLRAKTKIEVVRTALDLLERDVERSLRVSRWRSIVPLVVAESHSALVDFRTSSRLKRDE